MSDENPTRTNWADAVGYICVTTFLVGIGSIVAHKSYYEANHRFEMERIQLENSQKNKIHIQDLNQNNIPETFYVIDKDTAFVSIDGKHINDFLE
ncbi:MAG: hypothetical protein PHU51_03850 [Candidatus Nanoarchaeia archaeon]|nr:hypothetical protein [Candidatus Nanoarchaeia archaeon]